MGPLRRLLLSLALVAGLAPATSFAAPPPPVPALPDTERRTTYSITGTTCACAVNFALYGDATDYQNWIEVWLNGVRVNFNDPTFGWVITSPTGPLANIARPVTDAVLTFNSVQTGTVQIVGARRPRRTTQFQENKGVASRDLNQAFTDVIAQMRESWDKTNDFTGRALISQPGNTIGPMPLPSLCANKFLGFDSTGLNPQCSGAGAGSGNVVGPVTSFVGHAATWANTTGTQLADSTAVLRLPNPGTLSVLTTGNDSNSCLVGSPCLTLQHAINVALSSYDCQGGTITIQIGAGTFAGGQVNGPCPGGGLGILAIIGSGSSNTTINSTIAANAYANVNIGSMRITVSSGSDVLVENQSSITLADGGMDFGPAITAIVDCFNQSSFNGNSNFGFKISGGAQFGFLVSTNSNIILSVNATYTITGTPNFSTAFVDAIDGSGFNQGSGSAWSGSATGVTFILVNDSQIDMEQSVSPLPGNAAGQLFYNSSYCCGTPAQNILSGGLFNIKLDSNGELDLQTNKLTITTSSLVVTPGLTGTWPVWTAGTLTGGSIEPVAIVAAPGIPASGTINLWVDSTDLRFHDGNSAGQFGTTVIPSTAAAHKFATSLANNGVLTYTQPAYTDISGAGQIPGTATNDNASAGNVGEYLSSVIASGSAVNIASSGTSLNLTSQSFTAGDWDIDVVCNFSGGATTLVSTLSCGVSTTTGTFDNTLGRGATTYVSGNTAALYNAIAAGFPSPTVAVYRRRFSFSTTTTVFAVAGSQFSTSTSAVFGILSGRRMR